MCIVLTRAVAATTPAVATMAADRSTEEQKQGTIPSWMQEHKFLRPGALVAFHGEWNWLPFGATLMSEFASSDKIQVHEEMMGTILFTMAAADSEEAAIVGVSTPEGLLQTCFQKTIADLLGADFNVIELIQEAEG